MNRSAIDNYPIIDGSTSTAIDAVIRSDTDKSA